MRPGCYVADAAVAEPEAATAIAGAGDGVLPADEDPLVVKRWDYEPDPWKELLSALGFTAASARIVPAPSGPREIGTLLVRAQG